MCIIGLLLMVRKHYIAKIRLLLSLSSFYLAIHMFSDMHISAGNPGIEMDIVSLLWGITLQKERPLGRPVEPNTQLALSTEVK